MVDSVATFKARVLDLGLGDYWPKFEEKRFTTYAAYAFSSNFQPGNPDEAPFIRDTITPILGEDPSMRHVTRRLFYEAFALVTADMNATCEGPDEDRPNKMNHAEGEGRRKQVIAPLGGLDTDGAHGPAHITINLAYSMHKDNTVS